MDYSSENITKLEVGNPGWQPAKIFNSCMLLLQGIKDVAVPKKVCTDVHYGLRSAKS